MTCVQSVAELYASRTDEELLWLCVHDSELTPEAREMLTAEMSRRGLTQGQANDLRSERAFEEKVAKKKAEAAKLSRSGRAHFGKANRVLLPNTKRERFTTTFFFLFIFFPLVPLGTYRVERLKKDWRHKIIILERLPLDWEQVLRVWVVASAILLAVTIAVKLWIRLQTR